jgi:hypothetical protein
MTAKKAKTREQSFPPDFPLTVSFDNPEVRALFLAWLRDGGGESDFSVLLHRERGTTLDVDYDNEALVVVNEHGEVRQKRARG